MESQGLSAREVALLSSWERERRGRVTLEELRRMAGPGAPQVAHRMARKGVLERIGRGVYAVRSLRTLTRRALPSAPVLAAHLLKGETYYLGGLWALTIHRLTQQQYTSALDAFVIRRRRPRTLGHARLAFHVLQSTAFGHGVTGVTIEDVTVRVSDAERTVLDLLDYPGLAGDLAAGLALLKSALPHLDARRLVAHAVAGSRLSTCQRLGVLLERQTLGRARVAPLRRHVQGTSSRLSMVPTAPRRGRLNTRWNVVENDRPGGL